MKDSRQPFTNVCTLDCHSRKHASNGANIYVASIAPASAVRTGTPGIRALSVMRALGAAYAAMMRWLPRHRVTESSSSALSTNCAFPTAPLQLARIPNSFRSWLAPSAHRTHVTAAPSCRQQNLHDCTCGTSNHRESWRLRLQWRQQPAQADAIYSTVGRH